MESSFKADVSSEGRLTKIYNKQSFDSELKGFAGKSIKIKISKWHRQRTTLQNALLHAYLQEIADQTKMPLDTVKRAMKAKFLTVDVLDEDGVPVANPITGEVLREVRETHTLSTVECADFCEEIRLFIMDFGVYLKSPGENEELKFNL